MSAKLLLGASILVIVIVLALPASATATSSQGGGYWYLVKRGETLASIACKVGVSVDGLAAANGLVLLRAGRPF